MTAEQLKNSILQMAVQGKLVPQDPNDEPASELIKRIREEKEKLIEEGKIKKEKNPSYIFRGEDNIPYEKVGKNEPVSIADEAPFEIPESWEWVRLKDIILYDLGGGTPSKAEPSYWGGNIPWMSVKDFSNANNGFIEDTIDHITIEGVENSSTNVIDTDAIILCTRMGLGRTARLKRETAINQDLRAIWLSKNIDIEYFLDYYSTIRISGSGVTVKGIKKENLFSYLFPLPPINEQRRISNQYKKILPPIQEYGNVQNSVDALKKAFPELLKKSILQEAVMGKLVPQDENDEPASALLERIREEKQRLIAEGKLKKDKHESIIYRRNNSHYEKLDGVERCIDDEIPFEIPDSWEWIRLGNASTYADTKNKINAQKAPKEMWGLDLEDIEKGGRLIEYHTLGERKAIGDKTCFCEGDILYSKLRPYLQKILVAPEDGICTPEIVPFRMLGNISHEYIVIYLKSPYVDNYVNAASYGVKMPRAGTETMTSLLVPIPPISEQVRIVATVVSLLEPLKKL